VHVAILALRSRHPGPLCRFPRHAAYLFMRMPVDSGPAMCCLNIHLHHASRRPSRPLLSRGSTRSRDSSDIKRPKFVLGAAPSSNPQAATRASVVSAVRVHSRTIRTAVVDGRDKEGRDRLAAQRQPLAQRRKEARVAFGLGLFLVRFDRAGLG
jgi:hypothetical protein